jgi:hypothetical protein
MLAVQKWAEGRTFLLALFGPRLAALARDIHLSFDHVPERRVWDLQFPLPHLPTWFRLYRSHRQIAQFIRLLSANFPYFGRDTVALGEALREEFQLRNRGGGGAPYPAPSTAGFAHVRVIFQYILAESILDLKKDFSEVPFDSTLQAALFTPFAEKEIEGGYFLLVALPCWLLYRQGPTQLYRKARLGNYDALEKLLRLDPLLIHDPTIGKQVQSFRFDRRRNDYEKLLASVQAGPEHPITSRMVKYATAGVLSALGLLLNQHLSGPELRALFDAVAEDAYGQQRDQDLAENPEAFYQAIQRDRAFWMQMLDPDQLT